MTTQTDAKPAVTTLPAAQLIAAMLKGRENVSDLIFSPGHAPQVESSGQLVELKFQGLERLTPEHTRQIANELMGSHSYAREKLEKEGSTDLSYSIPAVSRFRVNIFRQRGTHAIVMRVIPNSVPTFEDLKLPRQLAEIVHVRNGIVLVTGPTGSGKSSTLAAIIDRANSERAIHILSIEDPIEFCHNHKKATVHQRELHSDTPTFALALRAALRQAPKIILVGEMRDRETIEIALEAAETGHLVLSTLHTIDASKTIERIVGVFPLSDQQSIRNRFSKTFRFIISQRLLPRREDKGRVAVLEILKSTMRTREYIEKGEGEGKSLIDAMNDGAQEGMQNFDGELEKLIRAGTVDLEIGLSYASNAGNLRLSLADFVEEQAVQAAAQLAEQTPEKVETR
jgi:twitching motility protein PilT